MRFAELDAVTLDAFGTLLALVDPLPALDRLLRRYGIERSPGEIETAFRAEAEYYRPRSLRGRDAASLAALRNECAGVFLEALGASAPVEELADGYVNALEFELVPGVRQVLDGLRRKGLELAVVSNWDVGLHAHLDSLGLSGQFRTVLTSAEAGVAKPGAGIFEAALARLGAAPGRVIHVGDSTADSDGARAAGLRFLPAPLATAFDGWT